MALFESKLNDFLIICITFVLVYWFQQVDDIKRCKERVNLYEKIKLPLLVSAIVALIIFWDNERILSVFITTEEGTHADKFIKPSEVNMQSLPQVLPPVEASELKASHPDLDIFTNMPEW